MKNKILLISILLIGTATSVFAQPDRIGQSGASELLMNTTAKSSGFNGINIGSSDGIESASVNPAGVATTMGTELVFSHTRWLIGTGISVNSIGLSQALGEEGSGGVLGINVNSLSLGKFYRTTTNQPDGNIGTFSPSYANIGVTYAKKFTDHIYVGATLRMISQATPDVTAFGACFDAGVQYRAMENDALKLGITLRNVGPSMKYSGQGLENRAPLQLTNPYNNAVAIPTDKFELPSLLTMGGSYDIHAGENNTISLLGGFISNAFYYNQIGAGFQYQFKNIVALRASYLYEKGITGELGVDRYSAYTGLAGGATFQVPFKASKKSDRNSLFGLDLSYRTSNPFGGTLSFGARVDL